MGAPFALWVYLSTTPLLWLTLTVVIWLFADWLAQLSGRNPLVNPVMIAIAVVSAILLATGTSYGTYFDVPRAVLISLAPKSVTAPVAMSLSDSLGGIPALTAVLVVFTGVLGAVIVTPLMNAMGLRDYAARGFAAGLAAHGIGTARAFAVDPVAGTFAGIAMGLSAILSSLLIPVIVRLLFPTA